MNKVHILCLNETKLSANYNLQLNNYKTIQKNRNNRGGGVAIAIRDGIEYTTIEEINKLDLEIIGIKIKTKNTSLNIITWYLPPDKPSFNNTTHINEKTFTTLAKYKPLVILGDLNSHSTKWFCDKNSTRGQKLEELLLKNDLSVINKNTSTTSNTNSISNSVIDLIIISNDINDKILNFTAINDDLTSDHKLVVTQLNYTIKSEKNEKQEIIKINKVNWDQYSKEVDKKLNGINPQAYTNAELNEKIILAIKKATETSTTIKTIRPHSKTLPSYLVEIIKMRKKLKNELFRKKKQNHTNLESIKSQINKLTKLIKTEIVAFREYLWINYCKTIEHEKKYSSEYWQKIKQIGNLNQDQKKQFKSIPSLTHNNSNYDTPQEKANLFGHILREVFSETYDAKFDEQHKRYVAEAVSNIESFKTNPGDEYFDSPFTIQELNLALKSINLKSSAGPDGVTNKQLKNLSEKGKELLLYLFNSSWEKGLVIDEFKIAKIIMINKKNNNLHDPNNYRPISLTNNIIKLMERMVQLRLISYLTKHKIISDFQSGFRLNRQTTDNLVYFCQKTLQAFNKNQIVCGVIFDILKAFDKVWLTGLIYKLNGIGTPKKLGNWLRNFLTNRKFYVSVENKESSKLSINAGVPQGAILSPTLFSIFINDIISLNQPPNYNITSLLFADDLFAFNIENNINRLNIQMQRYLDHLQIWLNNWRLNISPQKCSYTIYSKGRAPKRFRDNQFQLNINNEQIPINNSPKYLGVTIDRQLNFSDHVELIRTKCLKLSNVIKCLSYKNWSLSDKQQLIIYQSLIRSCLEYAPQLMLLHERNLKRLEGIQYHVLKVIYKEKGQCSSQYLHDLSGLETIRERLFTLSHNYLEKAIRKNNKLILKLLSDTHQEDLEDTILDKIGIKAFI